MADPEIVVPTFALPFQMGVGGTFACVEQDSAEEVSQAVFVLLSTPLGRQIEIPDYGFESGTFDTPLDLTSAVVAVQEWEPRAVIETDFSVDSVDELVRNVEINLKLETDSDA